MLMSGFTETFAAGNVQYMEPFAVTGACAYDGDSVRIHSKSTIDTDSDCAEDDDVPSVPWDLERFRTNDPLADEYPQLPGMLERLVTIDGFENYEDSMLLLVARPENNNAIMGSPFMMTPPSLENWDATAESPFMMAPASLAPFAASMGSPVMMMPPPSEPLALSHNGVACGSAQPSCGVPAAPPASALDRPRTHDWLENVDVPFPRGLLLTPIPRVSEVLSPSPSFGSTLPSPRSEIGSSPSTGIGEDRPSWETKNDAALFVRAPSLCGVSHCKPCYEHIRGRCVNDSCAYCHMPVHAIRRKQKKHQRRHQAQIESKALDARPGVGGMVTPPKAKCCAVNHHGEAHTGAHCQPCFKHIRGQCALGVSCNFCHDKIHADRSVHKKQLRSSQRVADRYVAINRLGSEI